MIRLAITVLAVLIVVIIVGVSPVADPFVEFGSVYCDRVNDFEVDFWVC